MTPGDRTRIERKAKSWSQQRLADEISRIKREKISRAAISLWESGDSKTQRPDNFFAAAQALGLRAKWVLDGTGDKHISEPATGGAPLLAPPALDAPESIGVSTHQSSSVALAAVADLASDEDEQTLIAAYRSADSRMRRIMLATARETLETFTWRSERA